MISLSHRFIFVHVCKTAGTSLRMALSNYAEGQHTAGEHATMSEWRDLLGGGRREFLSFAFVRNPFDWMVSFFLYIQRTPDHEQHDLVRSMRFSDYLHWQFAQGAAFRHQWEWLLHEGRRDVDFIGRFETLTEDLRQLGHMLELDIALSHQLGSGRKRPYQDWYSDDCEAVVAQALARDFDLLGYAPVLAETAGQPLPTLNDPGHLEAALAAGAPARMITRFATHFGSRRHLDGPAGTGADPAPRGDQSASTRTPVQASGQRGARSTAPNRFVGRVGGRAVRIKG